MNVVIINYGIGNIKSLIGALQFVGVNDIVISHDYQQLKKADKLILPGVGSFATSMEKIKEKNLDMHLQELVIDKQKPILGICLGMQLMGISSTENGESKGLGFVNAKVTKFDNLNIKVPHVGFNQVEINNQLKLYQDMNGCLDFYFTHSYKMDNADNINPCLCHYGNAFVASYEIDNIVGVQFHPELSQRNGLKIIKNFIENF